MAETLRAELQLSIDQFTSSLTAASQRVQSFAQSINSQMSQVTTSVTQSTQATTAFGGAWGVVAGLGIATTVAGIAAAVKNAATESVNLAVKMQSLEASFKAITGSAARASQELQFVRQVATKTGTDFLTTAQAFKGLEAAARGTSLEGAKVKEVFEAVSMASRVVGMSSEETKRTLIALEQMMSKGKVSAEELRRQMQSLPGAFAIAARAIGVTTEELDNILKQGRLFSEDFLPKFAAQIKKEFGPGLADAAKTAAATFARLGNEVQALGVETGNALLKFFQPIAEFIERTLRKTREARETTQAQGASMFGGIPEGATADERERLERWARLIGANPQNDVARQSAIMLSEQIRARAALNASLAGDEMGGPPTGGAFESTIKAIREQTKLLEAELTALNVQFKNFPATRDNLEDAKNIFKAYETAAQKVSEEIAKTPGLLKQMPPELQKQVDAMNQQLLLAKKRVEGEEASIEWMKEYDRLVKARAREDAQNASQAIDNLRERERLQEQLEEDNRRDAEHQHDAVDQIRKRIEAAQAAVQAEIAQYAEGANAIAVRRQRIFQDQERWMRVMQSDEDATVQIHQATTARLTQLDAQWREQQERELKKAQKPWNELGEDIQRTLSNAFENILDGSFDLFDSIKRAFIRLLADLAAAALTQQIIIPAIIGLVGSGSTAAYGATGGGGGGSTVNTALGLAQSGASIYSGMSGYGGNGLMGSVMNIPAVAGLLGTPIGALGQSSAGLQGPAMASGQFFSGGSSLGGLGSVSVGTAIGAIGAGVGTGFLLSKLNSMMGLHGTANTTLAGAGGGALAGTMILPGIGTAIGAAVGALGGFLAGKLGGGGKEPGFQIKDTQAGRLGYDQTLGLTVEQDFHILKDWHQKLGVDYERFIGEVDSAINSNFEAIVGNVRSLSPDVQQALVGPLNDAFTDIANKIDETTKVSGDEFKEELQKLLGETIPNFFKEGAGLAVQKLTEAAQKVDPIIRAFQDVMGRLQANLEALRSQQLQMRAGYASSIADLRGALYTPAESFGAAQGAYTDLLYQWNSASPQERILLGPQIASGAQGLLGQAQQLYESQLLSYAPQSASLLDASGGMGALTAGSLGVQTSLYTPAQQYLYEQQQYAYLKSSFGAADAAGKIGLAGQLSQSASTLMNLAKGTDVLGQDPLLVRNLQAQLTADLNAMSAELGNAVNLANAASLSAVEQANAAQQSAIAAYNAQLLAQLQTFQASLIQDVTNVQTGTDEAFTVLQGAVQEQITLAQHQVNLLAASLNNLGSVDGTIRSSLAVLQQIEARMGGNANLDSVTQAQVVLLGGLNSITNEQLRVLQEISQKLGPGVPQYAEGSTYIPKSTFGFLHKGERVIPAAQNDSLSINITAQGETPSGSDMVARVSEAVVAYIARKGGRYGSLPIYVGKR